MQFEAKFPTGLRGKAPNLDLLLGKSDGGHLAIESKFLEPYGGAKPKPFKEKYFTVPSWPTSMASGCRCRP